MTAASWRVVAVFALIELVGVGGLGAWAASRYGFNYAVLSPLAFLVYLLAGSFATRSSGSGAIAGTVVAFLDSLAWAAFGGVGPQPTEPNATFGAKAGTVLIVTLGGAVLGFLGGWIARRIFAPAA
jgi:hypothetical protein